MDLNYSASLAEHESFSYSFMVGLAKVEDITKRDTMLNDIIALDSSRRHSDENTFPH